MKYVWTGQSMEETDVKRLKSRGGRNKLSRNGRTECVTLPSNGGRSVRPLRCDSDVVPVQYAIKVQTVVVHDALVPLVQRTDEFTYFERLVVAARALCWPWRVQDQGCFANPRSSRVHRGATLFKTTENFVVISRARANNALPACEIN